MSITNHGAAVRFDLGMARIRWRVSQRSDLKPTTPHVVRYLSGSTLVAALALYAETVENLLPH
jgi:hypothetical protein